MRYRLSFQDASDIVQEAFVVAMKKLGHEGNAEAWFKNVVDRLSLNWQRKVQRRAFLLERWSFCDSEALREEEQVTQGEDH